MRARLAKISCTGVDRMRTRHRSGGSRMSDGRCSCLCNAPRPAQAQAVSLTGGSYAHRYTFGVIWARGLLDRFGRPAERSIFSSISICPSGSISFAPGREFPGTHLPGQSRHRQPARLCARLPHPGRMGGHSAHVPGLRQRNREARAEQQQSARRLRALAIRQTPPEAHSGGGKSLSLRAQGG